MPTPVAAKSRWIAFETKHAELIASRGEAAAEDRDRYTAENILWVPKETRWTHLLANAEQPDMGRRIDDAMIAVERVNPRLKDVLPKDFARPALSAVCLGELIDGIGNTALHAESGEVSSTPPQRRPASGRDARTIRGPRLRPLLRQRRDVRPSEQFVEEHGGRAGDIAIFGQELNHTAWRLCMMNLAVRGIEGDMQWYNHGTFVKDALPDLRADYVLAYPRST